MPWPAELPRLPLRHLRALVNCDAIAEELPLVVDGSRKPSPAMAEHLGTCLRCQAELAGYRHLVRVLRSLRDEPVVFPPPALVGEALRAVQDHLQAVSKGRAGRSRHSGSVWALAGSLAVFGLAMVWVGASVARSGRAGGPLAPA